MNLAYLNTFIEVVKHENLTNAAKKLYLSQPAVTLQIQKLEKELGYSLIERDTRHFLLTPGGKRFFQFAEKVCQEHEHLLFDNAQIEKGIAGLILTVASPIIGEFFLPGLISRFKENNHAIDINVKIMDSMNVIKEVAENPDILGFCSVVPKSPDLNFFEIGEDQTVLIVHPGHPLAIKKQVTIADLVGESLIFRAETIGGKLYFSRFFKKAGIDLKNYQPKMVMGTPSGVLSAVESKTGIGFISNLAIKNSETTGKIKVVKIKNLNLRHRFYFVHNRNMVLDTLLTNFIRFINQNKFTNEGGFQE